jgi:hypothetical protein
MSVPRVPKRQPFNFDTVYQAAGGPGFPIHTLERLEEVRKQHRSLLATGTAQTDDLFGQKVYMTLGNKNGKRILVCKDSKGQKAILELSDQDVIHVDTHSLTDLSKQDPIAVSREEGDAPHFRPEDYRSFEEMQRRSPFYLEVDWDMGYDSDTENPMKETRPWTSKWTKAWRSSDVRKRLIKTVKENASTMRRVTKIVCFGLSHILPDKNCDRFYIQHLAASDIATILSATQAKNPDDANDIEIFAQDPAYTATCKALLGEMSPPIKVVDFATAEGLSLIDENTFIISLNTTASILEPAIQIAGPSGPAGLLTHPWLENVEKTWANRWHEGRLPPKYYWGTDVEFEYKNKSKLVRLEDEKWFGVPGDVDGNGKYWEPVHAIILFGEK